ncbi:MAG TPA: gliding motility-associated C-terminal domain-containing protein, partial [Chitinophagaceae bacterium]|nr:gliding motility-associated C-terminal domain-containing protein [Chitinophagaceae bacterium]
NKGTTKDTLRVRTPGTYWGEVQYKGCTVRDTIVVSYVDAAAFSLGADTTICTGEILEIKTNISNAIHEWSTGETTGSIRVNTDGTYWVKVNNGSCTVTDTIRVKLQDKPVFDLGIDKNLCAGETALLELNIPGAKYQWQDSSMNNSFNVRTAGKYKVNVNLNGCVSADSINVSYRGLPIPKLANDTSFCQQQSLRLDASDPSVQSYEWQDGTTTSQITVTNAGVYTVKLLGANGCVNRDTIRVNATALPQFSLGTDTTLCDRQVLRLRTSLTNAGYRWSDGSAGTEMVVSKPGTYWLEVQQNGCSKRDSITVNFKPVPTVNLGRDTTLCEGVTKTLNALYDGARYTWQDLSGASNYQVTKPGMYHVAVDLNGCVARDSIFIAYKTRPQFSLGRDTAICTGEQLVLRPLLNNASYRWQDGSGTASYPVREAGVYSLTATNECGSSSGEIVITKGICKLYMPNAFTPNGDGLNDIFRVKDPGFIATMDLRVYNHFGELIFRTTDPRKGWDGSYKGQQQPNGNYVWQISITTADGEKDYKKGTVLLTR